MSFIFIKLHGSLEKIKIPLPMSLDALKDQCSKRLNLLEDDLTFYNEKTGKVIRNIGEIIPSMTISVSGSSSSNNVNPFSGNLDSDPSCKIPEKITSINHMRQFRHVSTDKEQILIRTIYKQITNKYLSFSNTDKEVANKNENQDQFQDIKNNEIDPSLFRDFIYNLTNSGFYNAPGTYSGCPSYRTILVGPSKSGKSTMLKMVAKQVYENLIQLNESREVFMFVFDFRKFKKSLQSIEKFYANFVNELVDQIAIQWPLINVTLPNYVSRGSNMDSSSTYAQSMSSTLSTTRKKKFNMDTINIIKDFFNQFVDYNQQLEPVSSKFPKSEPHLSISMGLNALGKRIDKSLNVNGKLKGFINEISALPFLLCKVFGFKRIYYVFDHVDEADVEIGSDHKRLGFISCIKKMLLLGSFTISCTDEQKIYDICEPVDEDDIDLKTKSNFVSIIDSFDDIPKSRYYFELKFESLQKPVIFQIEDCGGCGGYVARWREIQPYVETMLSHRNEKDVEKARLKALALLRQLAPLLIINQDPKTMNPEEITQNLVSFEIKT